MIKLAVVGHPNKGKSSIVATLTRNAAIDIDPLSGTTTKSQHYPVVVNHRTLYELVDTPGFQRPRFVLDWLKKQAPGAHERKAALHAFLNTPSNRERFTDEVELLTPIMEGAGILYVVDGGVPYAAEYETEMEILRWTGQARMAIINPIGSDQYVDQWRQVLDQFFSIVRVFNPITASHQQQCQILQAFSELSSEQAPEIQQAIAQLKTARIAQHEQAARCISERLDQMLSASERVPWSEGHVPEAIKRRLKATFEHNLIDAEASLKTDLLAVYQHELEGWQASTLALEQFPLFDQSRWQLWGVDRKKAIALSAGVGAAAGAVLDLGVGGSSLMAGSVLGGLTGGLSSLWLSYKTMEAKRKDGANGKYWQIGPIKDPQFGFVLLARALFYTQAIAGRTHADQTPLVVDDHNSFDWVDTLSHTDQVALANVLRKAVKGELSSEHRQSLTKLVTTLLLGLVGEAKPSTL